jgi:hypothetical protein
MKKMRIFLFFLMFFPVLCVFAADGGTKDDTVDYYTNNWTFKAFTGLSGMTFSQAQDGSDVYWANRPLEIGAGIGWKWLAISASFPLPTSLNQDSSSYAGTMDFRFSTYFRRFYVEFGFRRYNDFVMQDDAKTNSSLDIMAGTVNLGFVFSKDISLSAPYDLDALQKVSTGAPLVGVNAQLDSIKCNDANNKEFTSDYAERRNILHFGPTTGYTYTWVFSHGFFINLLAAAGVNAQYELSNKKWGVSFSILPQMALGFQKESFGVNFVTGFSYLNINLNRLNLTDNLSSYYGTLTFSKRF